MKIVIVGGGKLGFYLSKNMLDRGHEIRLVEVERKKCESLATQLDAMVISGDGTEISVLEEAEAGSADAFIAVGGRDEDNVVACQLAKKLFHVPKVVARVNNPKNMDTMKKLGVDVVVCNTEIITRIIEQEVDSQDLHLLTSLNRGRSSICALTIENNSVLVGREIKDLKLPHDSLIISIVRGEETIIPKGNTQILGGDEVIAVCGAENRKELLRALTV